MNRQSLIYRWPIVIYCIAIFVQSSFPTPEVVQTLRLSDKFLHLVGYALLGGLMVRMVKRKLPGEMPWKIIVLAIIVSTCYGVTDELHQALVPGRCADIMDVVADLAGSAMGAIVFWWDLPLVDRPMKNKT